MPKGAAPVRTPLTDWISLYLEEDIGEGDLTSDGIPALQAAGSARMVMRQPGTIAGLRHAIDVFARVGVMAKPMVQDGSQVEARAVVLTVHGPANRILAAERVALNIVGRMSGIATETRRLAGLLAEACCGAIVTGTRKTTPGFRSFEKEAIALGGGDPHRMGLYDAMMVKDNHREAAGGAGMATAILRAAHPDLMLEVEVETLDDALAAATNGADWLLIDNQPPDVGQAWAEAVWDEYPEVKIEASGGITADNLVAYGWADRISLGALTHAARSLDIGLDWGEA